MPLHVVVFHLSSKDKYRQIVICTLQKTEEAVEILCKFSLCQCHREHATSPGNNVPISVVHVISGRLSSLHKILHNPHTPDFTNKSFKGPHVSSRLQRGAFCGAEQSRGIQWGSCPWWLLRVMTACAVWGGVTLLVWGQIYSKLRSKESLWHNRVLLGCPLTPRGV